MKAIKQMVSGIVMVLMSGASYAALVMDFGSGIGSTGIVQTSYTQNGLTMTPLNTGSANVNHWDWYKNDPNDWHAAIHRGNNSEQVRFTYSGGAFDLLSIFIEDIHIDPDNTTGQVTGEIATSAGASYTVSTLGTINFTALTGFSNITWFTFTMPFGVGLCSNAGADCSGIQFDDVTFQDHLANVPLPATLLMMALGLFGLAGAMRR